jgi:alpha-N-arabinofuranosidase
MNAINTFDAPDAVAPARFSSARVQGGQIALTLPPKSVMMLSEEAR